MLLFDFRNLTPTGGVVLGQHIPAHLPVGKTLPRKSAQRGMDEAKLVLRIMKMGTGGWESNPRHVALGTDEPATPTLDPYAVLTIPALPLLYR